MAHSLSLRKEGFDSIITPPEAPWNSFEVSESMDGVYKCAYGEFYPASYVCRIFFLEPNSFCVSSLSYGQMGKMV
jgi:hypothetical protein